MVVFEDSAQVAHLEETEKYLTVEPVSWLVWNRRSGNRVGNRCYEKLYEPL
jgi:hypothetical protein